MQVIPENTDMIEQEENYESLSSSKLSNESMNEEDENYDKSNEANDESYTVGNEETKA